MFRFAQPLAFLLLLPVAAAAWAVLSRRVRQGVIFAATGRIPRRGLSWRAVTVHLFSWLVLLGLALAVGGLARPQTVLSKSRRSTHAIAIQMVVDVSGSMEALDMSLPNRTRTRLDAVKESFADFVKQRPDDLVGLVTFGGYASTRVPLTADHEALLHVLNGVEVPRASRDGAGQVVNQEELLTAVGDGLATGCARLKDAEPKSRIVVLLSDGESNTGIIQPEQATTLASKMGVRVYTIGVGSTGWAPFRTRDMFGREVVERAQVRLDEALLKSVAAGTGGRYFNVRDAKGLDEAMKDIGRLEKTKVEREVFYHYNELFPWLLVPGLIGIILGCTGNMLVARRVV